MTKEEYEEYLQSEAWAIRRQVCLDRFGGQCALCENRAWHAHHRTYDRVGHEHLNDLTALCGECHEKHHGKGKFEDVEVELMLEATKATKRREEVEAHFKVEFKRLNEERQRLEEERHGINWLGAKNKSEEVRQQYYESCKAREEEIVAAIERLEAEGKELRKAYHAARQT